MIQGRKVLAVIPARGGSKGIPLKNLRCIDGKPLVVLAVEVAMQLSEVDCIVLSTDHQEIARVAMQAGAKVPFIRPPEISGDRVADWDVLNHALLETELHEGVAYDIILMLQPTSPLRTVDEVRGALQMMEGGGYDAVWTVSETDSKSHPLKQLVISDSLLNFWDERGADIVARQQLEPTYHRNGVAYVISRNCLIEQKTIIGRKTGAYVTKSQQISIDTEEDFLLAEYLLVKK